MGTMYTGVSANFSRPADNTAYAAGDAIANSTTGSQVVPITFPLQRPSGRITGCRAVVTPASGNLVITALKFDLLLFKPESNIPFAAGSYAADNAALAITAAAFREIVGVLPFLADAWRNPAGGLTAGATGYQDVKPSARTIAGMPFYIGSTSSWSLLGVVQAQDAWTPTGIINRFDFTLDVEYD